MSHACQGSCGMEGLAALECGASCAPTLTAGSDAFELYTEGDTLYQAMLESIAAASSTVRLESYIFADDVIGREFANPLEARAAAGVEVRLHLDAAGCLFWSSRNLERRMRERGVQVRWFHSWTWRQPLRYNRRNHRKLLVVDEAKAYLGGFNIHRESSAAAFGEQRWRDTHVSVSGLLAAQSAGLFDAFWRMDHRWMPEQQMPASTLLLPNHTRACRHRLRCVLEEMFAQAKQRIELTTPYFVPDHRTQHRLMCAARRGVDVRLLVPAKSDVRMARWAARASYAAILQSGVRVYEYLPRMLHAKTAVVDGSWATVGTANLDYRSFFLNYELNLISRDPELCTRLQEQFIADLEQSREIHLSAWPHRPSVERLSEAVGWAARRWL